MTPAEFDTSGTRFINSQSSNSNQNTTVVNNSNVEREDEFDINLYKTDKNCDAKNDNVKAPSKNSLASLLDVKQIKPLNFSTCKLQTVSNSRIVNDNKSYEPSVKKRKIKITPNTDRIDKNSFSTINFNTSTSKAIQKPILNASSNNTQSSNVSIQEQGKLYIKEVSFFFFTNLFIFL